MYLVLVAQTGAVGVALSICIVSLITSEHPLAVQRFLDVRCVWGVMVCHAGATGCLLFLVTTAQTFAPVLMSVQLFQFAALVCFNQATIRGFWPLPYMWLIGMVVVLVCIGVDHTINTALWLLVLGCAGCAHYNHTHGDIVLEELHSTISTVATLVVLVMNWSIQTIDKLYPYSHWPLSTRILGELALVLILGLTPLCITAWPTAGPARRSNVHPY